MRLAGIGESVAGPEKCWPGYRKVGTKPGTGKNAGKRVNDCEKIKESADIQDTYKGWKFEVEFQKEDDRNVTFYSAVSPEGKTHMLPKRATKEQFRQFVDSKTVKEGLGDEVNPADRGEYDREGDMAINQLKTINDAATELRSILDAEDNLPEWVQSKITKAVDYIDTARDYMKSKEQGVEEQLDEIDRRGFLKGIGAAAVVGAGGKAMAQSDEEKRAQELRRRNLERIQKLQGANDAMYPSRIKARIYSNIAYNGPIEGNPTVEVKVKLTSDGTITSVEITKPSGVDSWDEAFVRAIKRAGSLPKDSNGMVPPEIIIRGSPIRGNPKATNEAYDPWDEGDMWYKFDSTSGTLRQRSWKHAQEREAVADGWSQTHEQALKQVGIIRSKFNPKKFVQKQGDKWVEVSPYGKT